MRVGAGLLAPFGIIAGVVYVFLIIPTLLAAAGTGLLWGYHRIASGRPMQNPVGFWVASLLFNAPGIALLFAEQPALGVWPLVASALSVRALWNEVTAQRRAFAAAV